jgi:hypothetical protein
MPDTSPGPQIVEAYKNYSPPFDVAKTVRILLRYVPAKYLAGLKTIVVTNQQAMSHDKKRRKLWSRRRKIPMDRVRGTYHQAWKGDPAWIELFIDKVVPPDTPTVALWFPIIRCLFVGEVLYHEIGHHIHKTQRPEYREREDVADEWGHKMGRTFLRTGYWYLVPLVKAAAGLSRRWEKSEATSKRGPA